MDKELGRFPGHILSYPFLSSDVGGLEGPRRVLSSFSQTWSTAVLRGLIPSELRAAPFPMPPLLAYGTGHLWWLSFPRAFLEFPPDDWG
jgi:hypothetical protein